MSPAVVKKFTLFEARLYTSEQKYLGGVIEAETDAEVAELMALGRQMKEWRKLPLPPPPVPPKE